MSTTVHVKGISHETTEKEVKDFFSFCGKITNLSITPVSGDANSEKSASVTFEKETAAKTALLLDNTQLGKSQVHVQTASTIDQVATSAGAAVTSASQAADEHNLSQEDKPRSRIVAEYLAHGYTLSDNAIQRAIALDNQHGFSSRFTSALQNFDQKYKVTDKSKAVDDKYKVTDKAWGAWGGLNSYFEKALNTPTGQKVRDFYVQGEKQVLDVHNEARRLADLKKGEKEEPHSVAGQPGKTACSCGGAEGVCGCAPGKCSCANCAKSDNPTKTENPPQEVKGTEKTVCTCGGKDGVCGCAPGKCACASCAKSTPEAVTEVKEAAQAAGQTLPKETFGTTA